MSAAWRLLVTPPAPGAWNMAVDEACLESVGRSQSLPTLRLYSWQPACLSLGYAQPYADVDLLALVTHGWDVVRRPTGGRSILHTDELTYAITAPHSEPRAQGTVLESYQRLAGPLVQAVRTLGADAEMKNHLPAQPGQGLTSNPVCFEAPSAYEITVGGKKLLGSAQARRKEGVLQHGSLPLVGDLTRILSALVFEDETVRQMAATRLLQRATTLQSVVHRLVDWQEAADAFIYAFEQELNVRLTPQPLTPSELSRSDQLMREHYAHPSWTKRI